MDDIGQMKEEEWPEKGGGFLMDSIPAGFFRCSVDEKRKVDMMNQMLLDLYGCRDREEFYRLTGGTLGGMVHSQDYGYVLAEAGKQLYEGNLVLNTVFRIVKKDGTNCRVGCRGKVRREKDGKSRIYVLLLKDMEDTDHLQRERDGGSPHPPMDEAGKGFPGDRDGLTSLLTPAAFERMMEEYLLKDPQAGTTAVLFLNMDRFQEVNWIRGRLFGNVVLMNVAGCLKRECREGDLIGRFGGDEFLILIKNTDREEAYRIACAISVDIGCILADSRYRDVKISCSIGIWMVPAGEKGFYDAVIKAAQAMHQAKKEGRGEVRFHEQGEDILDGGITLERLKYSNGEKLKEQGRLKDKTSTAIALEVFEKTSSFEEAIHILMGFIGNRFCLNRIVFYMNGDNEEDQRSVYQWVDHRTAMLFDPSDNFRQEEFYLSYNLYDNEGIAELQRSRLKGYSTGLKRVMDRAKAQTMLFASVTIDNRYAGMLVLVDTDEEREWPGADREAISEIARVVGINAKSSLRLKEAEYYKNRDTLTGLMNYGRFKKACQEVLDREKGNFVLVASDIKGFKFINEEVGYTQGDNILRMFADMLTHNGREGILYTRVSADQFLTFGPCRMEREVFADMVQHLNEEFCRLQNDIFTKVNIMIRSGIYFIQEECTEIEAAIDRATIARTSVDYIIKSTAVVFNDRPFDNSFRENEIINRMEYALKHGEFKVYLQPKYSLCDNRLAGAEALVRWQQEDGQIISPGEFIPLFEKNGFISQVDYSLFLMVCRKLREWQDQGVDPICISMNLSGVDIQTKGILSSILDGTKEYGIDHRYLEFELTETAFLKDTERTFYVMKVLRDSGFTTSIDDFGSGYSIMNMMADIPCDVIKLDCGFVQSCQKTDRGREFLRQLIQMTNRMGFVSLCEGIETKEQLQMVSEMGCSLGQGYYFAKPMPMDVFFEKYCKKSIDRT